LTELELGNGGCNDSQSFPVILLSPQSTGGANTIKVGRRTNSGRGFLYRSQKSTRDADDREDPLVRAAERRRQAGLRVAVAGSLAPAVSCPLR